MINGYFGTHAEPATAEEHATVEEHIGYSHEQIVAAHKKAQ